MNKKLPKIGITMGDPNGIGPEVIVKSLACSELTSLCEPVIFGSKEIIDHAKDLTGLLVETKIQDIREFKLEDIKPGEVDKKSGKASLEYIKNSVEFALENRIDAIVTAPINKESTHLAGSDYPGHTEMLSKLTKTKNFAMMFDCGKLRVTLVTIHIPLSDVPGTIDKDKILNSIQLTNEYLIKYYKIFAPKIAVCGLNPHASESGAFGNEERETIIPAIENAKDEGIDVEGPMPADTLFYYAQQGRWDGIIAMYHDQGLIPFKMLFFEVGVNVTLGLPIIRTSPDHGTAFDIAWKGIANPSSLLSAIKHAVFMANNRI